MSKCQFCKEDVEGMPVICPECGKELCSKHSVPEAHNCKSIEKKKEKNSDSSEDGAYIEEEVKVVKRKVRNETKAVKAVKFIINHHMLILVIALVLTGFYMQKQGVYDFKEKAVSLIDAAKFMLSPEEAVPETVNQTQNLTLNETAQEQKLEDKRTLIQKIQDTPSLYVNTDVEIEGFVEWKQVEFGGMKFDYVIYDEDRRYIPFLFDTQNVGFNKYFKYKLYGKVLKSGDRVYIDADDYERMT